MTLRFLLALFVLVCAAVGPVTAQSADRTGAELYGAGCASCHGPDGKGAPKSSTGFDIELPDFTDCKFSTPEPDPDWAATIHLGGRARAFDRRMPAFTDALTPDEITRVIGYLRGFCTERSWPRGDLNLPRPLVTEKAFPENEAVLTTTVSTNAPGSVVNRFTYEHRVGRRGQYEVLVPFTVQQQPTRIWTRGLGDIAVAYKHVLFDSLKSGSILSGGSEMTFPTGKENEGLGTRLTVFEPFGTFSQMMPRDGFFHIHSGFEVPLNIESASSEFFFRAAVGKTFSQRNWGRAWSPMVEVLTTRELAPDEETRWELVPELQVSLSRRQHILVNVGVRLPVNQRNRRPPVVMMYVLWDWFDGGLTQGW